VDQLLKYTIGNIKPIKTIKGNDIPSSPNVIFKFQDPFVESALVNN